MSELEARGCFPLQVSTVRVAQARFSRRVIMTTPMWERQVDGPAKVRACATSRGGVLGLVMLGWDAASDFLAVHKSLFAHVRGYNVDSVRLTYPSEGGLQRQGGSMLPMTTYV